jgi:2-polyprenyl-3-methyl-5-hydroxy-6-metoxy-1,4-benzoquinol methylase
MSAPRIAFPFFRKLYYRSLYGQNNFLEKQFSGLIQYGDRRWGKGDSPRAKEVWEAQYQNGMWDSLNGLGQVGRYSMIAGYLQHFKQGGILLDVGCGEGILQENLRSSSYSRYVGVDISGDAIKRASQRKDDRTSFVEADAISYCPNELFDAIIFNEVLYCIEQPFEVCHRYESYLKKGGIFVSSLFGLSERAHGVRKCLKDKYVILDEVIVKNTATSKYWICTVFKP